jgi:hypothetical protein
MPGTYKPYRLPSGGWGSARSVGNILRREGVLGSASIALSRHNKVDGYQCNSCAWVKPSASSACGVAACKARPRLCGACAESLGGGAP